MSVQSRHISTAQKHMWLMATILESAVLRDQMPGHEQKKRHIYKLLQEWVVMMCKKQLCISSLNIFCMQRTERTQNFCPQRLHHLARRKTYVDYHNIRWQMQCQRQTQGSREMCHPWGRRLENRDRISPSITTS